MMMILISVNIYVDLETFDAIQHIPIANVIGVHARQDLVRRLEKYQLADAELLNHCVDLIDNTFVPSIVRHAISGSANVRMYIILLFQLQISI